MMIVKFFDMAAAGSCTDMKQRRLAHCRHKISTLDRGKQDFAL